MITSYRNLIFILITGLMILTACQKNNCPRYWAAPDNAQVGSDGKKGSGENVSEADGERSVEFPLIRVKRDKNGIVVKKQVKKPKKKHKDPRKNYKGA